MARAAEKPEPGGSEAAVNEHGRRPGTGRPVRAPSSVSDVVRRAGSIAWAVVGLAIALAIVVYVLGRIAVVFPPLVLAGMIVFILNPFVTVLHRRGIPRAAGAGLAYLVFFGSVVLAITLAVPALRDQGKDLADRWPELRDNVNHWIDARADDLKDTPFEFSRKEIEDSFSGDGISVRDGIERATDIGFQVFHVLLILILAPIFAFYILVDLPHIRRVSEGLIPESAREDVLLVARRMNAALGGFFRGQLVVAFIVGVLSSIAMRLVGLPFWLLIGMIAGFFNLIPLIGPWVGAVPAVLVEITTRAPITALLAAVGMLVVQQIDNHFISPLVMQRAVKLHPVIVMATLLLGGSAFGFFGLLVAVPTVAVVKIVMSHVWRVHVLGQTPEEWFEQSERSDQVSAVGVVEDLPVEGPGAGEARLRRRPLRLRPIERRRPDGK